MLSFRQALNKKGDSGGSLKLQTAKRKSGGFGGGGWGSGGGSGASGGGVDDVFGGVGVVVLVDVGDWCWRCCLAYSSSCHFRVF